MPPLSPITLHHGYTRIVGFVLHTLQRGQSPTHWITTYYDTTAAFVFVYLCIKQAAGGSTSPPLLRLNLTPTSSCRWWEAACPTQHLLISNETIPYHHTIPYHTSYHTMPYNMCPTQHLLRLIPPYYTFSF